MLEILVTSKTRRKLLILFFTHSGERFYYSDLAKRLCVTHSALQRELKILLGAGLLHTAKEANIRYYWINRDFPIYEELKNIIFKTTGLAALLRQHLSALGRIDLAFIYGSVASGVEDMRSDIDLMIIGDPNLDTLNDIISVAEKDLNREINYTVFSLQEWMQRIAGKDAFVMDVRKKKKILIIGAEDELRRIA